MGLAGAVLVLPVDYRALGSYGYLGIFLVTLVATAGLILPVPYLAAVAAGGVLLNPVLVGLVAGVASATGELTGYLLGSGGSALMARSRHYHRARRWVQRFGFWAILALAALPNPFFDAAGAAAGSLGVPVARFWLACFLGKTARLTLIAWLASVASGR